MYRLPAPYSPSRLECDRSALVTVGLFGKSRSSPKLKALPTTPRSEPALSPDVSDRAVSIHDRPRFRQRKTIESHRQKRANPRSIAPLRTRASAPISVCAKQQPSREIMAL